ncbi:MAG: substrate-binding domain-containing protein [Anaerolineae bacterium]|nr:substrate-binding domain-containing protein [Anaerolineae bacterium]
MQRMWRSVLILLALLSSVVILSAQDEAEIITVVGSGIVNPVLENIITASETELEFDISTTGTTAAFEQLCAGETDIATANRAISVQETTVCRENEVEFLELLVGYDILAIISNAADGFASCLSTEQLDSIFAPSAAVTDWNQLNTEAATAENPGVFPELPLTVIVPEDTTLTYAVLDVIVSGVGFRSDATSADFDTILETVRSTSGAISAIPLELALANPDILPIAIQFPGSEAGCLPPSVDFVEQGLYPVLTPLLVYVNKAAQETLGDFLTVLGGESSAESIVSAGFSPASVATYETNLAIIAGEQASRTTSTEDATFDIPPVLTGTVTVGGATTGFTLANTAASNLTTDQANLTITRDFSGEALGITAFCNGELDILFVNGDGAFECEEESPDALTISLGYQAVVLLANAADDHTTCLTLDQIQTIWSASSTETVTQWSDVAESMPEQAMTLFGIRESNDILSDIMLTPADGGAAAPIRIDTEINFDPLYRAAAVANVEGALTYMKWSDYERVVQNGQERIQLVLINGDNGCIQPSEETITSGEYPLSLQTSVVINKASLADLSVESYVWTIFADSSLSYLNAAGFVGINANDLLAIRQDLLVEYTAALLAAAEIEAAAAEATEEAPEGDGAEATETAAEPAATEESSE